MSLILSKLAVGINKPVYPEDRVEFTEFKKICYQVSYTLGLQIHNVWKCGESKTERRGFTYDNYHMAHLDEAFVLCSSEDPYIGFVGSSLYNDKPFIDNFELSAHFSMSGRLHVLGAEILNLPIIPRKIDLVDNKLFPDLNEWEIYSICHWKPSVIGQVIFNEWD